MASPNKGSPKRLNQRSLVDFFSPERKKRKTPRVFKGYHIFCGLDGVLADFDAGVEQSFQGTKLEQFSPRNLYPTLHGRPGFFEDLPWKSDGREIWDAIRPLKPDILTSNSMGGNAPYDKFKWCQRELGVKTVHVHLSKDQEHVFETCNERVTNVITCHHSDMHHESGPKRVLIHHEEKR